MEGNGILPGVDLPTNPRNCQRNWRGATCVCGYAPHFAEKQLAAAEKKFWKELKKWL